MTDEAPPIIEARRKLALVAYWGARSHQEEHAAIQRMLALGMDTGCNAAPCMELECIALRQAETLLVFGIALLPPVENAGGPVSSGVVVTPEHPECDELVEAVLETDERCARELAENLFDDVPLSERGFGT